jgi:hypothetical protein
MEPADEPEPSLGEIIDRASRRLTFALIVAGAVIAIGDVSSRPSMPRYQAFALGDQVIRLNTRSGSIVACDGLKCVTVHRQGQSIERRSAQKASPLSQAPAQLPAKAAATP